MSDCDDLMKLPAIDVHGHVGTLPNPSPIEARLFNVTGEEIVGRAVSCSVMLTCVSELGAFRPHGGPTDVVAANRRARLAAQEHDGLRSCAVLNPKDNACWEQVEELLEHRRCSGAKLHPRWNHWERVSLDEFRRTYQGKSGEARRKRGTSRPGPGSERNFGGCFQAPEARAKTP